MSGELSISHKPVVAFKGGGPKASVWEVAAKHLSTVEGVKYVKLMQAGVTHGFPRLVFTEAVANHGLVSECKATWSLSQSAGYKELQRIRNNAQSEALLQKVPEWQRASVKIDDAAKKKRKKASEGAPAKPGPLTITIPATGDLEAKDVKVVRPLYDYEELRVEFDMDKLFHIIVFIASQGFDASPRKRERDELLPAGVHRKLCKEARTGSHTQKFLVPSRDGSKKKKLVSSLDEWQAQPAD